MGALLVLVVLAVTWPFIVLWKAICYVTDPEAPGLLRFLSGALLAYVAVRIVTG